MHSSASTLVEPSRAKRLKAATHRDHDSVDSLVMGAQPFASLAHYERFLRLQHRFHGAIDGFYRDPVFNERLPGLDQLPRFSAVQQDLRDLGFAVPQAPEAATLNDPFETLGWLYCSEGSNLGAAFLFKETQQLGLDGDKGARHLAAHPDGRGLHWRQFVALLDSQELNDAQEQAAIKGAIDAFNFYRDALRSIFT